MAVEPHKECPLFFDSIGAGDSCDRCVNGQVPAGLKLLTIPVRDSQLQAVAQLSLPFAWNAHPGNPVQIHLDQSATR